MLRNRLSFPIFVVSLLFVSTGSIRSAPVGPLRKDQVPETLRPWTEWVLFGHEEERCPFFQGDAETRRCLWPSALQLDLDDRGGRFTQRWLVFGDEQAPLPGDGVTWPQDVRLDGAAVTVVPEAGRPVVRLGEGRHVVSGSFEWKKLPSVLAIPSETGLLRLTVRGRAVPFPGRDTQGRLWLEKPPGTEVEESRVDITVNRLVADDIPLILVTRVDLQVSGESRETQLGHALPDGLVPMSLVSPLPARLDPDGRLRVQLRPGRWTIDLTARHEGPAAALTAPQPDGPWSGEETWVFDARPDLRLVTVEGVPAVDPQQTTLPDAWKRLPAYLVRPGETMTLTEKRRGDAEPLPDRLALSRTWWLDFDGSAFTQHDRVTGTVERLWRLELPPPAILGRVAVDGEEVFITRLAEDASAGVEIRSGSLQLEADSRLPRGSRIPAVGWDEDFQQVSGELRLPPGWRVFHISGADRVYSTWIASWTLLDFFLVLITALAIGRLWGWRWSVLGLTALVLTWTEIGAPRWAWLAVIAGEALLRVLPRGRLMTLVRLFHRLALVVLIVIVVPFMLRQVRMALYPVLEYQWWFEDVGSVGIASYPPPSDYESARGLPRPPEPPLPPPPQPAPAMTIEGPSPETPGEEGAGKVTTGGVIGGVLGGVPGGVLSEGTAGATRKKALTIGPPAESFDYRRFVSTPDLSTVVQTGPGLPDWQWRSVRMQWQGPVLRTQTMRFLLVPPAVNFIADFLRVALMVVLVLLLLGGFDTPRAVDLLKRWGLSAWAHRTLPVLCLLGIAAGASPARADIPTNELLNQLRDRLTRPSECSPDCASIPRLALEVTTGSLRMRLEVHAAASTAVPLPGAADQWLPAEVLLDGKQAPGLLTASGGQLWLQLDPGPHEVLMQGPMPDRGSVQIPLALKPHRVTASSTGWRVDGLDADGLPDDSLQLTRLHGPGAEKPLAFEPGSLPPFVRVERELRLGIQWGIVTNVVRMTPPGVAVLLEVPLLAGESVTTSDVRIEGTSALVTLAPQVSGVRWESTLTEQPSIELRAPGEVPWVEVWRVVAGPLWHLETQGIPPVHTGGETPVRLREWHPWPGESLRIDVTRPAGTPGQTLTFEAANIELRPGLRATDTTLELTIRSSRGGQHPIPLPEGAELQSVSIDGRTMPIRAEDGIVTLPVRPGRQTVSLVWRTPRGIGLLFRPPGIPMGAPVVNVRTTIRMPGDRWTLFLGGPGMKPAVLFWTTMIVNLIVSFGLGLIRRIPLRWYHWFLLSLGLTQVPIWASLGIAGWILALEWRRSRGAAGGAVAFDMTQLLLTLWTVAALTMLFWSIEQGLLGLPEMQIAGNGSTSMRLEWYLDRTDGVLPRPWVFSIPLLFYRLAMLAWALWIAQALLGWLKWGWGCFTEGGFWLPLQKPAAPGKPAPSNDAK